MRGGAEQVLGFRGESAVPAGEHDGHAEGARQRGVHGQLADGAAVQAGLADAVGVGVIQDGVLRPRAGVVADAHRGVESAVDAFHHRPRLGVAAQEHGGLVQLLGEEVAHEPVAVVDEHLVGAGLERAVDGGVGFGGHEPAEARVLRGAARVDGVGLVLMDDPGNPFHVDGDVDAHGLKVARSANHRQVSGVRCQVSGVRCQVLARRARVSPASIRRTSWTSPKTFLNSFCDTYPRRRPASN